jgi:FKBP12-rapamycin complex-associated protein
MQLFSLTNSILHDDKFGSERHLNIHQVPIVPLAPNAGLIAWAEGGETIYSMIAWHRKLTRGDVNDEQLFLRNYIGDEAFAGDKEMTLRLSSIQKLELHQELCNMSPDDDIRETMWLRSQNSETWLGQTTNFGRSNGLMSIIGYIIGIGDRHPSNILVMKRSGNVIHIDFSDCFEKASLRSYVHETVPFRLTRMLVKALGPSGIKGVFAMTAEYVMGLMRRNKDTLLAFLDIFVQDPITDTIWYKNAGDIFGNPTTEELDVKGGMFRRAILRVSDKLNGKEFERVMDERQQVARLIDMATSKLNLARMYYGWAPFW